MEIVVALVVVVAIAAALAAAQGVLGERFTVAGLRSPARPQATPVASAPNVPGMAPASAGAAMSAAARTMRGLNENAVWGREGNREVFIEDVKDPDGRLYRMEYQADPAGRSATAFCRYNPWGGNPFSAHESHLYANGQLCLGNRSFTLDEAVQRSRFWCAGYSYLHENGYAATRREIPEW